MHRFAVGEEPHEFVVVHARPGPHIADVEMDEGRARRRIIADAAALHAHADFANLRHRHSRHGGVHRFAQHVLGIFGDGARPGAQHGVCLWRAIGGDDMHDLIAGARMAIGLPDDIEEARVHVRRLVPSPVAQEPVQLLKDLGVILPVDEIRRRNRFMRMGVVKMNGSCVAIGHCGFGHLLARASPGKRPKGLELSKAERKSGARWSEASSIAASRPA